MLKLKIIPDHASLKFNDLIELDEGARKSIADKPDLIHLFVCKADETGAFARNEKGDLTPYIIDENNKVVESEMPSNRNVPVFMECTPEFLIELSKELNKFFDINIPERRTIASISLNINLLLSKFNNGREMYESNAIFANCIESLVRGQDIYKVLEDVINLLAETSKRYQDLIKSGTLRQEIVLSAEKIEEFKKEHNL